MPLVVNTSKVIKGQILLTVMQVEKENVSFYLVV